MALRINFHFTLSSSVWNFCLTGAKLLFWGEATFWGSWGGYDCHLVLDDIQYKCVLFYHLTSVITQLLNNKIVLTFFFFFCSNYYFLKFCCLLVTVNACNLRIKSVLSLSFQVLQNLCFKNHTMNSWKKHLSQMDYYAAKVLNTYRFFFI